MRHRAVLLHIITNIATIFFRSSVFFSIFILKTKTGFECFKLRLCTIYRHLWIPKKQQTNAITLKYVIVSQHHLQVPYKTQSWIIYLWNIVRNPIVASRFQHSTTTSIWYFICFKYFVKAVLGAVRVKYCWIIYLSNIVRNPIVASHFQHSTTTSIWYFICFKYCEEAVLGVVTVKYCTRHTANQMRGAVEVRLRVKLLLRVL